MAATGQYKPGASLARSSHSRGSHGPQEFIVSKIFPIAFIFILNLHNFCLAIFIMVIFFILFWENFRVTKKNQVNMADGWYPTRRIPIFEKSFPLKSCCNDRQCTNLFLKSQENVADGWDLTRRVPIPEKVFSLKGILQRSKNVFYLLLKSQVNMVDGWDLTRRVRIFDKVFSLKSFFQRSHVNVLICFGKVRWIWRMDEIQQNEFSFLRNFSLLKLFCNNRRAY